MLEFDLSDFEEQKPEGFFGEYADMPMQDYRDADGLANSELQLFLQNPSSYVWNQNAPTDPKKATSADFGTALHTSLLEPELFDDSILVAGTKGRTAQAFLDMQYQNPDKIVLTEDEVIQVDLMTKSAKADPMFKSILDAKGVCEHSIFVACPETQTKLKIRVDKIIYGKDKPLFVDVKSSADLDEWRNDRTFVNPLFKLGYGFTAAYYLYVGSLHYQVELTEYCFAVVSKSACLGRYPVSVFKITKDDLIEYGFWEQMLDALESFKECAINNKFRTFESFPQFHIYDGGEIEIKEV